MKTRFLAALTGGLVATLLVSGPYAARPIESTEDFRDARESRLPLREILAEDHAPGVLRGLRTTPIAPIDIDATGTIVPASGLWETDPDTGAEYRRGEVLVKFVPGVSSDVRAQTMSAAHGDRVITVLPDNWQRVALRTDMTPRDAVTVLRSSVAVARASLNYRVKAAQFRPNDEFYRLQWNFDAIDLPRAWEINPGATASVVVAVIDTGLNVASSSVRFSSVLGPLTIQFAAVPDLVSDGRVVAPFDFVFNDSRPFDFDGHGTHVTGTIAQLTNNSTGVAGVAYNVKVMPLKVIANDWDDIFAPGNAGSTAAALAAAIRHAADNGAHVINLSLGGTGELPIVEDALRYAVDKGLFVAVAAGNDGDEGNPVEYPAAYGGEIDGVMAVGATNRQLRHSPYSGFRDYVEICAPGGETMVHEFFDFENNVTQVSYNPLATLSDLTDLPQKLFLLQRGFRPRFDDYELIAFQGTSMATPHISGVAALLRSQGITDPRAIEEAIEQFARSIDATADECGAGLVDPRRALFGLGLAR